MLVYAKSYTSGTQNVRSSNPATGTAASKVRVTTPESIPAHDTSAWSWMQWALDQLDDIATLGPDWDSYGADAPSSLAIATASNLLRLVDETFGRLVYEQSQPQLVAPRADGGIQIEWGTQPVEIAVHADPSGSLGYLFIDQRSGAATYQEVQSASLEQILQLIATVVFTA
jgi:hypothetical protein